MRFTVTTLLGAGRCTPSNASWQYVDTPETCRIYYIHSGRATFLHGEEKLPLTAGKLYFLPPRLPFCAVQSDIDPMNHTFFDFFLHPQVVSEEIVVLDCVEHPELSSLITAANCMLEERCIQHSDEARRKDSPLISCLETILNRITDLHALKTVDDPVILAALDLIAENYAASISVHSIAEQLGYCTDHFIRRFQKAMGVTPYQYMKSLKLHDARLLRQEGLTLREVAAKTGYGSDSTISRLLSHM